MDSADSDPVCSALQLLLRIQFQLQPLSQPERFMGDSGDCRAFLVQCGLHFELQAPHFPTELAKIAYIISHLSGRAEAWATAEWHCISPVCSSLQLFIDTFCEIFESSPPGRETAKALFDLRQDKARVTDYATEFRTLVADSGWNASSLFDAFVHGLSDQIKDQLAPLELPSDIYSLIALCIKIDNCLREREKKRERDIPPEVLHATRGAPLRSIHL